MPLAVAYHRPTTAEDAVALLHKADHVALAGGTVVNADREHSTMEVVDLQALGLAEIDTVDGRTVIGSMTTLAAFAANLAVGGALASFAKAELPSTLRTLATVGGTVAVADRESLFYTGLLAHDARVTTHQRQDVPLPEFVLDDGELILSISVDSSGTTAHAVASRTPADTPIVAAVARSQAGELSLALSGVAKTPVLVDPADPTAGLDPSGDFRGSSDYRMSLAETLSARALEGVR